MTLEIRVDDDSVDMRKLRDEISIDQYVKYHMESTFKPTSSIQAVMAIICNSSVIYLPLLLSCFRFEFCGALDTITSAKFIKDPQSIVSNRSVFRLGFFSPDGSTNRYVGIWYNTTSLFTVIWIANRDKPLNDSSGIVMISEDGNLLVLNSMKEIFWSSNVSSAALNSSAQLLDSGNLVLQDKNSGRIMWESFQHPSNSFVQNMKLRSNIKTGEKQLLTSWKSPSDPSIGSFSAGISPSYLPELCIWNGSHLYWRSGPSNGQTFIGIPNMNSVFLYGFHLFNHQSDVYATFSHEYASILWYYILTPQGTLLEIIKDGSMDKLKVTWQNKKSKCDVYGKCGAFGICNSKNSPICSCLRGYQPKYTEEWNSGDWTGGCVKKKPLTCEKMNGSREDGKVDGFIRLTNMKVPDFAEWLPGLEHECREWCLKNCSCMAYSYYTGIGCMSWSGNLIDVQKFGSSGTDLYIRVAYSELAEQRRMKVIVAIALIIGIIAIAISICTYFSRRWISKQRGNMHIEELGFKLLSTCYSQQHSESAKKETREEMLSLCRGDIYPNFSDSELLGDDVNQVKLEELPLLDFEKLVSATNNFHEANKLGQGGFGSVYRGKFPGGQDIAVKRLSRASAQGLQEFMNEVVLISKLQHRNLVRLLGCCFKGEEKILIYEYMPNKSLDAFLFDPLKKESLNWRKRFSIIEGIGRGLLYLHRDSRLRIIHRDLKASNILLDEDLNPKISDFGMARIFGRKQDQANTVRVVGTYGYMSPEYAIEGRFSEKSDVFSFGVLLLEIAWKLWNEDNMEALIDGSISEACFQEEILRCIHVGLLCVQELAKDRPSISTVVPMLCSEIAHLPPPKQPAFTERQIGKDTESSQLRQRKYSVDRATITVIHGRWYLQVLKGQKDVFWWSNDSNTVSNLTAQLLDSGNLVLQDHDSGRIIWENFQHHSNHPNWLSGPLNGQNFVGVSNINTAYLNGFHIAEGKEGIVSITFAHVDPSILLYYLSTPQGTLVEISQNLSICRSLRCSDPKYIEEWSKGNCSERLVPVIRDWLLPHFLQKDVRTGCPNTPSEVQKGFYSVWSKVTSMLSWHLDSRSHDVCGSMPAKTGRHPLTPAPDERK
ncbi:G-type lectin S-receptor-like serine/threonine-protein kinase [Vitis vinifera]|uniref:non-specific serine/threonine protein kinase n=1 Tax=Vitis vinifera TaxID=29760 RepID=A0A438BSA0_VITVI|nr:G-type lectin S-receptor-like serine/threonine-protein kinase [Vitis vinifera]